MISLAVDMLSLVAVVASKVAFRFLLMSGYLFLGFQTGDRVRVRFCLSKFAECYILPSVKRGSLTPLSAFRFDLGLLIMVSSS